MAEAVLAPRLDVVAGRRVGGDQDGVPEDVPLFWNDNDSM